MKRRLATALSLAVVAGGLWWTVSRERAGSPAEEEPREAVWRMIDASKEGAVDDYLACFTGDLRARLEASTAELGEEGFAAYLDGRVEELKGVALYDVEQEPDTASLTIEYVFAEQSERQRLHLEKTRAGWRIARAEASRREKSLIPYGTPIEEVD